LRSVGPAVVGLVGLLSGPLACASSEVRASELVLDFADAPGDVRLVHPIHPDLGPGTFDLEHVTLAKVGDAWRLEATFASPVPTMSDIRAARDRIVTMVPQTIDVYLDTVPEAGHIAALPGRDFRVPAGEAWDRVLVVSSMPDLSEDDVVQAARITASGRRLIATFPGDAIVGPVRGVLVVVLATSPTGDGRVRRVGHGGDCRVWDDDRCRLEGAGPPVLDALGLDVRVDRPLSLTYVSGERPKVSGIPVVFQRGTLLSAAPVVFAEVAKGRLATVLDAAGEALGTAIVLNVVGDTAALEVVGSSKVEGARTVVFAAPGEK